MSNKWERFKAGSPEAWGCWSNAIDEIKGLIIRTQTSTGKGQINDYHSHS